MDPSALYESPFIDINSQGPEGMFPEDKVTKLWMLRRFDNEQGRDVRISQSMIVPHTFHLIL